VTVILGLYVWAAGQGDWHPRKKTAGTGSVRAGKPEKDCQGVHVGKKGEIEKKIT